MKYLVHLFLVFYLLTACSLFGGGDNAPDIPGKIVFAARDEAGTSQIYTMKANGTDVRQLTHFDASDGGYQPSWSPDGSQIVFSTTLQSSSNGFSLFIMDADGSNRYPMHDRPRSPIPTPGNHARWSPDSTKIAWDQCVRCQVGTNIELFVYDFTTDSVIQLTNTDYPVTNSYPTWSPDGQRIAFVSNRDYGDADTLRFRKDLYVINSDGTGLQRLTESGFSGGYIWKDQNHLILTSTDRDTGHKEIAMLEVETGKQTYLMENLDVKSQLWVFWNPVSQQLLTVNKNHEEQPVIIATYDVNGNLLQQIQLESNQLKSAINFDWFYETK